MMPAHAPTTQQPQYGFPAMASDWQSVGDWIGRLGQNPWFQAAAAIPTLGMALKSPLPAEWVKVVKDPRDFKLGFIDKLGRYLDISHAPEPQHGPALWNIANPLRLPEARSFEERLGYEGLARAHNWSDLMSVIVHSKVPQAQRESIIRWLQTLPPEGRASMMYNLNPQYGKPTHLESAKSVVDFFRAVGE